MTIGEERSAGAVRWARLLLHAVILGLLALGASVSAEFPDEGFYLLAARNVREGRLPYRDFAFFHAPGSAELIAWFWPFTGASVHGTRGLFVVLAWGGIALASVAARRVASVRGELAFLVLVASNPFMLTTLPFVASYTAPVALCLGAWLLGASGRRAPFMWLAGIALGFATGTRLTFGAAALVALVLHARRDGLRGARAFALALALGFVLACGTALPALFPLRVAYDNVVRPHLDRARATPYLFGLQPFANKLDTVVAFVKHIASAVVVLGLALKRRAMTRRAMTPFLAWCLLLTGVLVLVHLLPTPTYVVYDAALFLPILLAAGVASAQAGTSLRLAVMLAGAGLLLQRTVFIRAPPRAFDWIGDAKRTLADRPSGLAQAKRALAAAVPPGSEVWTFDTSVAVDAGMRVPRGFEMSYFGYYSGPLAKDARQSGLLDVEAAVAPLIARTPAAVVASRKFAWERFANVRDERARIWRALCSGYEPAQHFLDRNYSDLWLFLPRRVPTPDTRACEAIYGP